MKSNIKPPLGLIPKWLHDELCFDDLSSNARVIEIKEAIERYQMANMPIPNEWTKELKRIVESQKY